MELILSDGTRTYDFLASPRPDIYVQAEGIVLPTVSDENTFAEGSDSEGRTRIRSRATNSEAGSFSVFFDGANAATFWDNVDNLQELVLSAHRNKGTLTYTPPGGVSVTFDLEAINISDLPQRGVQLQQLHGEATVSFETKPYGRLDPVTLGPSTKNLIPNSSFETTANGWTKTATSWTASSMTRESIAPYTGSAGGYALYVTGTKDATGTTRTLDCATAQIPVTALASYTLKANGVNVTNAGSIGSNVYLEWRTAGGAFISFSVGSVNAGTGTMTLSVSAAAPATAAFVVCYLRTSSAVSSDTVATYWDAIQFEAASSATAYADSNDLVGPIDFLTVSDVPGQASANGLLGLTDASTIARNQVEVGVQHDFDPENPEPILLQAVTNLTALGGSSNTRAGSYSTNILRAALTTTPVAVCKAASQPHKGMWKVRVRVYPSATTVRVRLAWRAGDGPFAKEKWVKVPNSAGWYDLDLGTVDIKELPSGHTSEFRVEAFTTSGVPTVDVDYVTLMPADNYTKLRGSASVETPSASIIAVDDFSTQTAGAVTGKTPLLVPAGNWSGAGDADDFQVDATSQWIYRNASADSALNNGRYLRCGSSTLAATTVSGDVYPLTAGGVSVDRLGVMLRYVDTSNWLMCVYTYTGPGYTLSLIKRVAGVETVLAAAVIGTISSWRTLTVGADTSGNVLVYEGLKGGTPVPVILTLADANLATAGAIASGGYGFYDATTAVVGPTRYFDNFSVSTLATSASIINPAINSGYGLSLTHETALTASSTSTGTTPIREGKYLTLEPSTRNNTQSRIVVRARRDDGDLGLADSGLTDTLTASLAVTPRVHLTGAA